MTTTRRQRRAWAARSPRHPAAAAVAGAVCLLLGVTAPGAAGVAPTASGEVATAGAVQETTARTAEDATEGPAEDATAEDGVSILLDEVDPAVLRPGQPATLRGRVVNDGSSAARISSLTLTASYIPLYSRSEVEAWLTGPDQRPTPWVLGDDALGAVLHAGTETSFEITVPGSSLELLPQVPSVLAVSLTAGTFGTQDDRDPVTAPQALPELRTVLTTTSHREVDVPLETSWVVPLVLPADEALSSPDDTEHTAAWLAAVGQHSLTTRWLEHLTLPEVTWLVDPAVLVAHQPAPALAVRVDPVPEEDEETGEEPQEEPGSEDEQDPEGGQGPDDQGADENDGSRPGAAATTEPPTGPTPDATDGTDGTTGSDPARTEGPDGEALTRAPDEPGPTTAGPVPVPPPAPEVEADPPAEPESLEEALARLRGTLAEVDPDRLWWLPTDDPDLAVLVGEGTAPPGPTVHDLLTRSPADAPEEVARLLDRGRHDIAWPVLAAPSDQDITRLTEVYQQRLDDEGLTAVVLPRESFTGDSAAPPRSGALPLRDHEDVLALGADSWTTGLVAAAATAAQEHGAGAASQHLLAHTLGTWWEAPDSPRSLVIAPPRGTQVPTAVLDQLSQGWQEAGWLEPAPAQELLDRADDLDPVALSGVGPQEPVLGALAGPLLPAESPLEESRVRSLVQLEEDLAGLGGVLRDSDALRSWLPVLAGQWSTRWRTEDHQPWVSTWRTLRHEVRSTREAVHVVPSSVNFVTDNGLIHVTVVNDLPVAVEDVRLTLAPSNGRLQVTSQPEPVSVGPGSRATIPFQARAITRGETVLTVTLTTPDGTRLGERSEVSVRVQPTGVWIYWVLGGLAGLVLVLGLWRALHSAPRVPRVHRDGDGDEAAAYPGASDSPGKENPR